MNFRKICVLDFETTGKNPDICEPVQLAAVMLDARKLEIIPGSEFNTMMCPPDVDEPDFMEKYDDNLGFHAKVSGKSKAEVVALWRDAPSQKAAWNTFVDYLNRYHTRQDRKGIFTAPICAGYNILQYDWKIIERLSQRYENLGTDGKTKLFFSRDRIDVMCFCFNWFENLEEPSSYSMDNIRDFFGMIKEGAHDAMKDVKDTAEILVRFLRLHRRTAEKVKFKQSFKPEPITVPNE